MRLGKIQKNRARRNVTSPAPAKERAGSWSAWWARIDWSVVRFRIVGVLFVLVWGALWVRAGYIQLWEGPYLAERARRQHMSAELVQTPRGSILDRSGNILARSVECRSVYANPNAVDDVTVTAKKLAEILGVKEDNLRGLLEKNRGFVWITRRVDDATAEAVRRANLPGVGLSREYMRIYPYREVAGQLLGFVGIDGKGLEGLERAFDETLAGLASRQLLQRDASGRHFYVDGADTESGAEDVRLTIDLQVQAMVEEVLAKNVDSVEAKWGGVLVADTETGDILAWAQYPFFNPNSFKDYPASVFRNRLALDALEPGSTFKPFIVATGLQEGVINKDTVFNCENGLWKTKTITIRDDTRGYKDLTVTKILSLSSNIGMAKIGLSLGANRLHQYVTRLGFGQRTGLHVAESRGIVRRPRDWSEADIMTASFGQSLSVTVVQMAQAYMTIANKGMAKPLRLVTNVDAAAAPEQRVFSESVTRDVLAMMHDVVETGTGKRANIDGLDVAGKTGTAQKADKSGKYGKERTASFVGLIPAAKPRYLIVTFLDEPSRIKYGGIIATPVFHDVAERVLAYYGDLPDEGAVRADVEARKKPDRRKVAKVEKPKVVPVVVPGEVRQEMANKPAPGLDYRSVPDVMGKSVRRAVEMFAQQGLVPVIKGEGAWVIRQSPEPGAPWNRESGIKECVLWLSEK